MINIDINKGKELERRVIVSSLMVDEAVTPEDKLKALREAYTDSALLLSWYKNIFASLSGLFDEAVKDMRPDEVSTSLRPDDIHIDM